MILKGLRDWGYSQRSNSEHKIQLQTQDDIEPRSNKGSIAVCAVLLCSFTVASLAFLRIEKAEDLATVKSEVAAMLDGALVNEKSELQTVWQCGQSVYSSTPINGLNCFELVGPNSQRNSYNFIQFSKLGR